MLPGLRYVELIVRFRARHTTHGLLPCVANLPPLVLLVLSFFSPLSVLGWQRQERLALTVHRNFGTRSSPTMHRDQSPCVPTMGNSMVNPTEPLLNPYVPAFLQRTALTVKLSNPSSLLQRSSSSSPLSSSCPLLLLRLSFSAWSSSDPPLVLFFFSSCPLWSSRGRSSAVADPVWRLALILENWSIRTASTDGPPGFRYAELSNSAQGSISLRPHHGEFDGQSHRTIVESLRPGFPTTRRPYRQVI